MRRSFLAIICGAPLLLALAQPVAAHFLWVDVKRGASADSAAAEVYFNEDATAGSARLATKIAPTKAYSYTASGEKSPLDLRFVSDADLGRLTARIVAGDSRNIAAHYEYGVFRHDGHAVLLQYYAQHVDARDAAELTALARAGELPLGIVPRRDGQDWVLDIVWQGQPAQGCAVVVSGPDVSGEEFTSDEHGAVRLPGKYAGEFSLRARKVVDKPGKKGDQEYGAEHYFSTLTARLPAAGGQSGATVETGNSAELSADQILAAARDARAMWDDFPGFTADLVIAIGSERLPGRIQVSADGEVELLGFGDAAIDRPRQILESLVQHRSGGGGPLGHVSFVDEQGVHPLGRLIRFEEDKELNSAYRVQDNVVTEVNRLMGPTKFTISVLDVHHNPDGKYLPTTFNVSFWDKDSGRLKASETHLNDWLRVGNFELPERIVVFRAEDGKREVVSMEFAGHRLLGAPGK